MSYECEYCRDVGIVAVDTPYHWDPPEVRAFVLSQPEWMPCPMCYETRPDYCNAESTSVCLTHKGKSDD